MDNSRPAGTQYSPPAHDQGVKKASPEQSRRELRQAIHGSNDVLVTASTVLALFPDTITVDRAKLTVTKRTFLQTAEVMSLRIEDILNVTASFGPVFGTIQVMNRLMNTDKPYTIGKFWRKDAMKIKRITQGYVIALQREIDCSALKTPELARMLDQLGEDDHPN